MSNFPDDIDESKLRPFRPKLNELELPSQYKQKVPESREEARDELRHLLEFEPSEEDVTNYWYEYAPWQERLRIDAGRRTREREQKEGLIEAPMPPNFDYGNRAPEPRDHAAEAFAAQHGRQPT